MKRNIVLIVYTCILTVLVGCMWVIVFDVIRAIFYLHEQEGRLTGATADGTVLAMLVSFGTLGLMAIALCIWTLYANRIPAGFTSIQAKECFDYIRKHRWPDTIKQRSCYYHDKQRQGKIHVLSWHDRDMEFLLNEQDFQDVNKHYNKTLPAEEIFQSKFIIISEYMAMLKGISLLELTMEYVKLGFASYDSYEHDDYGKHCVLIAKTGYAGLVYDQTMRLFNYMKDVNCNPHVEKKDIKDTVIHYVHIENGNILIMTELEYFYGSCLYDRWIDSMSGQVMPDGSEF